MPPLDIFWEPESNSNSQWGISQFDALMWSPEADQSRKKTLAAANSKIHYVDTPEFKAIRQELDIVSGHIWAPAKDIVSSQVVQAAIAAILEKWKAFVMIEQYSNLPNAPLNQIYTQWKGEVFYKV